MCGRKSIIVGKLLRFSIRIFCAEQLFRENSRCQDIDFHQVDRQSLAITLFWRAKRFFGKILRNNQLTQKRKYIKKISVGRIKGDIRIPLSCQCLQGRTVIIELLCNIRRRKTRRPFPQHGCGELCRQRLAFLHFSGRKKDIDTRQFLIAPIDDI